MKPWFDPEEMLIGGRWLRAADTLDLHDPSTGQPLARIPRGQSREIDAAIAAAHEARAGAWGRLTATERGRLLTELGRLVRTRIEDLAVIEAHDVGKPLSQARADATALARYLEFYGGAADKVHGATIPYLDGYTVYTLREP
ncbi:MAG: aldehyde dehydrogenase family protein, partial [Pseudomonadota bacterium]